MRTSNPTLRAFQNPQTWSDFEQSRSSTALNSASATQAAEAAMAVEGARRAPAQGAGTMTINGTIHAAMILVGLCASAALATWMLASAHPVVMFPALGGGMLGSFLLAVVIWIKPATAPYLSPVYAVTKGAFLGAVSLFVAHLIGGAEGAATGIIFQAIVLTFGILFGLLAVYRAGLVRIGQTVAMCMYAALIGVLLLFVVGLVINLFGGSFPMFYELFGFGQAGWIGIGFSLFLVVLASLFLVLDFQVIEHGASSGAPKYMEWYGGFALLVTLAWLYFESLRLLSKLWATFE